MESLCTYDFSPFFSSEQDELQSFGLHQDSEDSPHVAVQKEA